MRYLQRAATFAGCLLLLPLLNACSFTNRFVVYNRTNHDLLLRYKLLSTSPRGFFSTRAVAHTIKRGGAATDTCTFDPQTGIVAIRLRKGHCVTIGSGFCTTYQTIANLDPSLKTGAEEFNNLHYLEIISDKGQLRCEGDLLETLITKNSLVLTRVDIKEL